MSKKVNELAAQLVEKGHHAEALELLAAEDEAPAEEAPPPAPPEAPVPPETPAAPAPQVGDEVPTAPVEKGEMTFFVTADKAKIWTTEQLASGKRVYLYRMPEPFNKGFTLIAAMNTNTALSAVAEVVKGAIMDNLEESETVEYFDRVPSPEGETVGKEASKNKLIAKLIRQGCLEEARALTQV